MKKINFSLYFLIILFLIIARPSFSIDQELRDMMDTLDAAKADALDKQSKVESISLQVSRLEKELATAEQRLAGPGEYQGSGEEVLAQLLL